MQYPVVEPRIVGWLLGQFITALAAVMLIPLVYGVLTGGGGLRALTLSIVITAVAGGFLMALSHRRPEREIKQREGILVVVLIWMSICFFGSSFVVVKSAPGYSKILLPLPCFDAY